MNRLLLTICCLLLLFFFGRQEQVTGAKPITMTMATGFCSGDCASCGCPPALAASNNCCCTRTRQLRHPELLPSIAVTAMPQSPNPHPLSLCCAPCNRAPVAVTTVSGEPLLLPSVNSIPSLSPVLVRTSFLTILLPLGRGATAPPSPPPEIVA